MLINLRFRLELFMGGLPARLEKRADLDNLFQKNLNLDSNTRLPR